jgi:hypothetical protein
MVKFCTKLNKRATGDETWTFQYDPETKRQSAEWHTSASPKPKKMKMSNSKVKTMLIVFFDVKGVVHKEFLPQGQTVNAPYYVDVPPLRIVTWSQNTGALNQ